MPSAFKFVSAASARKGRWYGTRVVRSKAQSVYAVRMRGGTSSLSPSLGSFITGAASALIVAWILLAVVFGADRQSSVISTMPALQKAAVRASGLAQHLGISRHASPALHSSSSIFQSFRRNGSTTAAMTHDTLTFKDAIQHRRTIYHLTKKSPISDERIKEILTLTIKDVPSSFNSQSTRIVALLKQDHDRFWAIVEAKLKPIVAQNGGDWSKTAGRLDMFKNAYGSILFYEDTQVLDSLRANIPAYADKFGQWSEHTSAMHQYTLWTALAAEGFGCNLQHYNPLPDDDVAATWDVPATWSLKAQLVIGAPAEGAREKLAEREMKTPIAERLIVHGA